MKLRFPAHPSRLLSRGTPDEEQAGPPLWVSLIVYALLSVLMTWPLASQLNTHVATADTDVFNTFWGNWWMRNALGNLQNPFFTDHLLYPSGFSVLAFGFSPFLALLWIPLTWVLPPVAGYNLVLLLTIVLSCLSMDQFVRYLTGNGWAGLVAGVTFGFAPALVAERQPHPSKTALFWIPWALLLLTRLVRNAKIRDAILLAGVVGAAWLTQTQVGVPLVMFCAVYLVGLAIVERKTWHKLAARRLLLAAVLSLLVLSPYIVHVARLVLQPGGGNYLVEQGAELAQTDLLAYLVPPKQHPLFGSLTEGIHDQVFVMNRQYWVYLGIVPLLLVITVGVSRWRRALPLLLSGFAFFVLALGPYLRVNGKVYTTLTLPYGWAPKLFGLAGYSWPNRFNLGLMVAVGALVGLASALLYERFRKPWVLGIVTLLVLGEYCIAPMPTAAIPPESAFYQQMAGDGEEYAIVDLPLTRPAGEVHRYYQTIHHKPIAGGWIRRVPDSAFALIESNPLLAPWLNAGYPAAPGMLDEGLVGLSEANVRYIVVHKDQIASAPKSMRALLGTLAPVYQDAYIHVLAVEPGPDEQYTIAHRFGEDLALTRPILSILPADEGQFQQLALSFCWVGNGRGLGASSYRVTLAGTDGLAVYEMGAPMPSLAEGFACDVVHLDPPLSIAGGDYSLGITILSSGHPLDSYATSQPLQVLQTGSGTEILAMGSPAFASFDAPFELLGTNLMEGDGFVWIDTFWSRSADFEGTYEVTLAITEADTGLIIAQAEVPMGTGAWDLGELGAERTVLWLDGQLPDGYDLHLTYKQ